MNEDEQRNSEADNQSSPELWNQPSEPQMNEPQDAHSEDMSARLNDALEETDQETPAPELPEKPVPDLSTEPVSEQPVSSIPTPGNKSHKKLVVTIVVLVVLLLTAIAAAAYLYFTRPSDTTSSNNTEQNTAQTETPAPAPSKAADIIKTVRTALTNELAQTYPDMKIKDDTSAPTYQAPNVNYAVGNAADGYSLRITPTADYNEAALTKTHDVIAKALEATASFKKTTNEWNAYYTTDDVVCSLGNDGVPLYVGCGDVSIYAEEITSSAPFAKAYLDSTDGKKYGDGLLIHLEQITEKSDGYKNARTSMGNVNSPVGGYAGLFYYDTAQWVYWRGTQSQIDCVDFNTHALQKSFEGMSCYDQAKPDDTTTVVKVTL